MKYQQAEEILQVIDKAKHIVILQADNPDGDSLGSALALEQILADLGKEPYLYCGVVIPTYLHYLPGWDRVQQDLPDKIDASIIVDTSAISLFENLEKSGQKPLVSSKPSIIIDHHDVEVTIPFATVVCNQPAVATGEIIYELARQLNWNISTSAGDMLAVSILSDSLGLISEATTARTIHIVGELVENGVNLAKLDNNRRTLMRKSPEIVKYKGQLLQRIEYFDDNKIAIITIPWDEIEKYSYYYNPSMLVLDDMRLTEGTDVAIAFKLYPNGRITAKIRSNFGIKISGELAKHFGGGGHTYASGFKISDGRTFDQIKSECIEITSELLSKNLTQESEL